MTIHILSEPISITEILGKYITSQNILAILALILKSGIVHNRNLLCNEMCRDVAVSKQWQDACVSASKSEGTSADFAKYMD